MNTFDTNTIDESGVSINARLINKDYDEYHQEVIEEEMRLAELGDNDEEMANMLGY